MAISQPPGSEKRKSFRSLSQLSDEELLNPSMIVVEQSGSGARSSAIPIDSSSQAEPEINNYGGINQLTGINRLTDEELLNPNGKASAAIPPETVPDQAAPAEEESMWKGAGTSIVEFNKRLLQQAKILATEQIWSPVLPRSLLDKLTAEERKAIKESEQREAAAQPTRELSLFEKGARGAVVSGAQMIPGIVASIVTKNPTIALSSAGIQTGLDSYGSAISAGKSHEDALKYASVDAAIEVATEKMPTNKLLGIFGADKLTDLRKQLFSYVLGEAATEQAATLGQSINAYANDLDAELASAKTDAERIRIQAERQAVTAISSVLIGSVFGGAGVGMRKLAERAQEPAAPPAPPAPPATTPPAAPTTAEAQPTPVAPVGEPAATVETTTVSQPSTTVVSDAQAAAPTVEPVGTAVTPVVTDQEVTAPAPVVAAAPVTAAPAETEGAGVISTADLKQQLAEVDAEAAARAAEQALAAPELPEGLTAETSVTETFGPEDTRFAAFESATDKELYVLGKLNRRPAKTPELTETARQLTSKVAQSLGIPPEEVAQRAEATRVATQNGLSGVQAGAVYRVPTGITTPPVSPLMQLASDQIGEKFSLPEGEKVVIPEAPVDPVRTKIASVIKDAFGVDVVWASLPKGGKVKTNKGRELVAINGARIAGTNAILLDANNYSFLNTLGHELTHVLETQYPQLYQQLVALAKAKVSKKFQNQLRKEVASDAEFNSELVAEMVGEQSKDPAFWQEVFNAAGDQTSAQGFLDALNRIIDRILNALQGYQPMVVQSRKDALAVRQAAQQAFQQWITARQQAAQQVAADQQAQAAAAATRPAARVNPFLVGTQYDETAAQQKPAPTKQPPKVPPSTNIGERRAVEERKVEERREPQRERADEQVREVRQDREQPPVEQVEGAEAGGRDRAAEGRPQPEEVAEDEVIRDLPQFSRKRDVVASEAGEGVSEGNVSGFEPALRVKVSGVTLPEKPIVLVSTTNKNAARQISELDRVLDMFPNAGFDTNEWAGMMAYATKSEEVPAPPYRFIKEVTGDGSAKNLRRLTQGQIDDASHGFDNAREFRRAYVNKELDEVTTGKLFLWSFLSRGISPYTQEAMFIDSFAGIDKYIRLAAEGKFTESTVAEYLDWAKTIAPAGSGQAGAGAKSNLNSFGQDFLLKMGRRGEDGKSHLRRLHEMLEDPDMTGRKIRREFATFGEGVGIDNKVVSFTLLVVGFNDVMVLDRVQIRQLWDDGRFKDRNLYDGRKVDGKVVTGSALSSIGEGVRGILVYEAIERALDAQVKKIYTSIGRPQDASIGRYHWETWVADSQQEASHGTLEAILKDAKGDDYAIATVTAKQGEYGAYEYGARYGVDMDNNPYYTYTTPDGGLYKFDVPGYRQFLGAIKKQGKSGVVPTGFSVQSAGNQPWYNKPEVNREKIRELAGQYGTEVRPTRGGEAAVRGADEGQDAADAGRPDAIQFSRRAERRGAGRVEGGPAPLDGAPVAGNFRGPIASVTQAAEKYAKANGINYVRQSRYITKDRFDTAFAQRLAEAYQQMEHAPSDPAVAAAYAEAMRQTRAQYDALVAEGIEFYFLDPASEYARSPFNAMRELRDSSRMGVFSTVQGFGSNATEINVDDNPMLADTGLTWKDADGNDVPVLANDLFRAVHDAFGHGLEGAGFRYDGEENAWQAHVRLYTGTAVGAVTSETRGQNSWVNFGPFGEKNRTASPEDTVYADQKTGLMPEWTWTTNVIDGETKPAEGVQFSRVRSETNADGKQIASTPEFIQNFWNWFGDSKLVDRRGRPKVMYHGTIPPVTGAEEFIDQGISVFRRGTGGAIFVSPDERVANTYAGPGGSVYPLYVRAENPFDFENPDHVKRVMDIWESNNVGIRETREQAIAKGKWQMIENVEIQDAIKLAGFDSYYVKETGAKNLALYDPSQLKSAVGNVGAFSPETPDIQFSRVRQGRKYWLPEFGRLKRVLRAVENEIYQSKSVQEAVQKQGGVLTESTEIESALHRMYGRAGNRIDTFRRDVLDPIIKRASELNVSLDDIELYLYASHAKEANSRIASIDPKTQDGGSGMTNAEADQVMATLRQDMAQFVRIKSIADEIQNITKMTQSVLVNGDLVSPAEIAAWNATYKYYVPLKTFEQVDDSGRSTGNGRFDLGAAFSKRRKGRSTKAGAIFENILGDYEEAVVAVERNNVRKVWLKFILDNKDSDLWQVNKPVMQKYISKNPTEQVRYRLTIQKDSETLPVKVGGEVYHMVIKDPAVLEELQMTSILSQFPDAIRGLLEAHGNITRGLAKLSTTWSPSYIAPALWRDTQVALATIGIEKNIFSSVKLAASLPKSAYTVWKASRNGAWTGDWKRWYDMYTADGGAIGSIDLRTIESRRKDLLNAYREAQANIGDVRTYPDLALRYLGKLEQFMMSVNGALEGSARLAAYKIAIENGESRLSAVKLAKDITVNFNRRGRWAPVFGSMYMFFNAAVQSSRRTLELMFKTNRGRVAMAGLVAFGIALAENAVNATGDDGEPYWDKPSFRTQKLKNFIFGFAPDGTPYQFVLPYGIGFFVNLGYAISDLRRGVSPYKVAAFLRDSAAIHFSPFGSADNMSTFFSPTVLDYFMVFATGEKSDGTPLMPEDYTGVTPDSQRVFNSTRDTIWEDVSKFLYDISGAGTGSEIGKTFFDISPESLKFTWSTAAGGLGTFLSDVITSLDVATQFGYQEALDKNTIPIVKSFYRRPGGRYEASAFYENSEEVKRSVAEWKALDAKTERSPKEQAYMNHIASMKNLEIVLNQKRELIKEARARDLEIQEKAIRDNEREDLTEEQKDELRKQHYESRKKIAEQIRSFQRDFNKAFYKDRRAREKAEEAEGQAEE